MTERSEGGLCAQEEMARQRALTPIPPKNQNFTPHAHARAGQLRTPTCAEAGDGGKRESSVDNLGSGLSEDLGVGFPKMFGGANANCS